MTAPSHHSRREPTRQPGAHRRAWSVPAATLRVVGRVLRGLVAAAVLLALVVGLPWALWHYIGWPLPDHIPTWAEVQGVLLGPMSSTFLLDVLACLCWITWAAFTVDVLRCTVDAARSGLDAARLPTRPAAGPVHALAAVLVSTVLVAVLDNRPTPPQATSLPTVLGTGTGIVATAPAWHHSPPSGQAAVRKAVFATHTFADGPATVSTPTHPPSVTVRAPENGVHDSLWRIAGRTLGNGTRWPEIFELNKGKPQPYGHTLTKPSLIFPGEKLLLPADATVPPPPRNPPLPPAPTAPSPATSVPPTSPQPTIPAAPAPPTQPGPPATIDTNSQPSGTREPGFSWGPELFVGLGLAAAVSAALLVARRRYRNRYRPGSGDRDDLPVAPVVYQLRLAHLRAEQGGELDPDEDRADDEGECPERVPPPPALVVGAPETGSGQRPVLAPGLGVRDGREIALDLATARGLGLVGAGAPAAARALLVAALTASAQRSATTSASAGTCLFVPADDVAGVLGRGAARAQLPATLRVVAGLDDALDALEAETLVRAAASREQDPAPESWPALVLVARPPEHQRQRLQAVLDNGAPFGITGLLLGQWQPGITAYVREDGTISATSPGLGEALRGTRMFRLGSDDTADVLTLLRQAEPDAQHHPTRSDAEPIPETELEVTAAVQPPVPADTDLEILGPSRGPAPGARLRPPAAPRRQPQAPLAPEDNEASDEPVPTGEHATTVVTPTPAAAGAREVDAVPVPITITVLGALRVQWHPEPGATGTEGQEREITGALQPRTQELLVLLALHPDGATREALVSALWGSDPPARPTNALHTALSRMRHAVSTTTNGAVADIVLVGNGRYQLDPAKVRVDYWRFADAVAARRAASTDQARVEAYREVINSYGGPLAEGMSAEWIEPAREAIRRDAIDAVAALARALVEHDPQQTLDLLEVARAFDPHNELLYRDIMRLQERLGQLDAIPRTLTLLTTRLAEIDEVPTAQTRGLAARLGQRHDDTPVAPERSAATGRRGRSAAS